MAHGGFLIFGMMMFIPAGIVLGLGLPCVIATQRQQRVSLKIVAFDIENVNGGCYALSYIYLANKLDRYATIVAQYYPCTANYDDIRNIAKKRVGETTEGWYDPWFGVRLNPIPSGNTLTIVGSCFMALAIAITLLGALWRHHSRPAL